jgi:hypothetical protein
MRSVRRKMARSVQIATATGLAYIQDSLIPRDTTIPRDIAEYAQYILPTRSTFENPESRTQTCRNRPTPRTQKHLRLSGTSLESLDTPIP